jgi:DNA-3-methyladenine glycosylase
MPQGVPTAGRRQPIGRYSSAAAMGIGAGILLRAIEPLEGIERMKQRAGVTQVRDLARGPGRLARTMRIDKRFDGADLCASGPLWLGSAVRAVNPIGNTRRIGITRGVRRKLRFYERSNRYVSGPLRLRK